jgi:hypothetical protein
MEAPVMATRSLITLAALLGFGLPAYAAPACVITYANDMGAAVTREIRNHEYAHCNGWTHPHGWDMARGYGKAYIPPKSFLRKFAGAVYENAVSTADARELCEGSLGCSVTFDE